MLLKSIEKGEFLKQIIDKKKNSLSMFGNLFSKQVFCFQNNKTCFETVD
jgi:hypothetical protein